MVGKVMLNLFLKKEVDNVYLSDSEQGWVAGSCDAVVNFYQGGELLTKWKTVYPLNKNTAVWSFLGSILIVTRESQ
jgi:hypothetical protein